MRIAFVHYHLKPGGVTTVIRRQIEALEGAAEVMVLSGEPVPEGFPATAVHVPGLAYDRLRDPAWTAGRLADAMMRAVMDHWPGGCDLMHVHNPTLAKNRLLTETLERLKNQGVSLFLHIHDFAEDGRPEAYGAAPYPEDCHYAVLNRRDLDLLRRAGLTAEGVHLLPNQVAAPAPAGPHGALGSHVLYPVRALRRKNIGEALLCSCFLPAETVLAITLGPNSSADRDPYRFWQDFAARHCLAVVFEAGINHDFAHLMQTARFLITTSVSEGFGFAFLEPWTAGKLLWGRNLGVCEDFAANGVDLDHLYPALKVPTEWLDCRVWQRAWIRAWNRSRTAFGRPADPQRAEAHFQALAAAETVDLALLNEPLQAGIIVRCRQSDHDRAELTALNPFLARPGKVPQAAALIAANAASVARHYGREADRRRLLAAYDRARRPVVHRIDRDRLLDAFWAQTPFSLLRWGSWTD